MFAVCASLYRKTKAIYMKMIRVNLNSHRRHGLTAVSTIMTRHIVMPA
jgi:hypothetical protein